MRDVFAACIKINDQINNGDEPNARNSVIKLLADIEDDERPYPPVLNHLIRRVGLFPYIDPLSSSWNEQLVYEAFKVDVGGRAPLTLHREQSLLLKRLLNGDNIAVSAPTSFGKSFVIDAYISIKRPKNVAIIVPTIALTDETRRRLYKKFGSEYKFITTTEVELAEKNIFIFPQERAISYISKINRLDILIIDEFYKASREHDKERSTPLLKAILKLGDLADQRYFLAPNIKYVKASPFTEGMEFFPLDMNTVYLSKHNWYSRIELDEELKNRITVRRLLRSHHKTLVYIGTYAGIKRVSEHLISALPKQSGGLSVAFSQWLAKNYTPNWQLVELAIRGIGVHNGSLHRSLSQVQIKLFEEEAGLNGILSTSSIIEGINTSARNVIIWQNKNGPSKLKDFTYKNIMGRSGRMFKHFIGHVDILDDPPIEEDTQLSLAFTEDLLADVDEDRYRAELTTEQLAAIIEYKENMAEYVGREPFAALQETNAFVSSDYRFLQSLAASMRKSPEDWRELKNLRIPDPRYWDRILFKLINLKGGSWGIDYTRFVRFVKLLSRNWGTSMSTLISTAMRDNITIDDFFRLERKISFDLASLVSDVNTIQLAVNGNEEWDVSGFIYRISNAFLPETVYQLEEYGLPRTISRKIHDSRLLNFEADETPLHEMISQFIEIGFENIRDIVSTLDDFDVYILKYFYDGITVEQT